MRTLWFSSTVSPSVSVPWLFYTFTLSLSINVFLTHMISTSKGVCLRDNGAQLTRRFMKRFVVGAKVC